MSGAGAAGVQEPTRFVALDSLRGIVAILVAAHHLNSQGPLFGQPLFRAGVQFVDFFFVLSGFVIAGVYGERLRAGYPAGRFLWLRLGRIYPAHLLMVLCYLAIELYVSASGNGALTGRAAFATERDLAYLPAVLLLVQCLWPDACMTWNVQSWSISVELMLYLTVAFTWHALGRRWWIASLIAAIVAAGLIEAGLLWPWEKLWRGFCGFGLGAVLWHLLGGLRGRAAALPSAIATLAEVAAVIACGWTFVVATEGFPIVFSNGIFAVTVLVFAAQRGMVSRILLTSPFVLAGTISYSIYMVHALVETLVLKAAMRLLPAHAHGDWFAPEAPGARPVMAGDVRVTVLGLGVIALVLVAAWLLWRFYEWPARQWSRRVVSRSTQPYDKAPSTTI